MHILYSYNFHVLIAAAYRYFRSKVDQKSKKDWGVDKADNTVKCKHERL